MTFNRTFMLIITLLTAQCYAAIVQTDFDSRYIMLMMPKATQTTKKDITDVMKHFEGTSQSSIRVGLAFIFSYLRDDVDMLAEGLSQVLSYAQETDTPVLIKFDGEQWWQNRPDLWNWWDPNQAGFNPDNRKNVEWTWWGPEHAIKICWRNWANQIRVLPPPNLMSPAYRKACHESMDVLMPVLLNWYKALPENKKHLFAGLNLGWESSIGINAFYYPNGNDMLNRPKENDPNSGTIRLDVLSRGVVQQGYAAVSTSGIRTSGDITEEDLYKVVSMHLEDICKYAYDFGFPRDKIISHGWGNENGERMYDAAVNSYCCPGWSMYWYADDPGKDTGIMRNVQRSDAPYWAVAEWLLPKPREKGPWKQALTNIFKQPGCKLMCVYGWRAVMQDKEIIEATREFILENNKLNKDSAKK